MHTASNRGRGQDKNGRCTATSPTQGMLVAFCLPDAYRGWCRCLGASGLGIKYSGPSLAVKIVPRLQPSLVLLCTVLMYVFVHTPLPVSLSTTGPQPLESSLEGNAACRMKKVPASVLELCSIISWNEGRGHMQWHLSCVRKPRLT